jgi:O-antigen/teichoic acid export membrane protein
MIRDGALVRRLASTVAAGAAGQAGLVVSGILVARMLGADNRGHLALLMLLPLAIVVIGGCGFPIALTYAIAREPRHAKAIVRAVAWPVAVQWVVLILVHWTVVLLVVRNSPDNVRDAGLMTLPLSLGLLAQIYGLALLQGQQRFRAFNTLRTVPATAYAVAVLSIVLAGDGSLVVVAATWTAVSLAVGALTIIVAARGLRQSDATGDPPRIRSLVLFGAKAFLGATSPIESFQVDQLLIGAFLTPAALGLYVVALAFTNLPRLVAQSVGMVAYPDVASRRDLSEARAVIWRYVALTAVAAGLTAGGLAAVAGWLLPTLVGRAFGEAVPVAQILLIAAFFLSLRRVLADGANGAGLPAAGTIAEIAAWVVLAPAVAVLLPLLGAKGVAIAMAISAATNFIVLSLIVRRPFSLPGTRSLVGRPAQ